MDDDPKPTLPLPITNPPLSGTVPKYVPHLHTYRWNWFLMPMTTCSLSTILISQNSMRGFHGLYTIGLVVYFIGLAEFLYFCVAIGARF
jgi:hypothetical protein